MLLIDKINTQSEEAQERTEKSLLASLLEKISPEEQLRTDKKMRIAAIISDAIDAKGWGKKQFADEMGKRPSEITKWLSGTQNFTLDTLTDIEQVLNIRLLNLAERNKKQAESGRFKKNHELAKKQNKQLALS